MSVRTEFDSYRQRAALREWLTDCRDRMLRRFPGIDFLSDQWPVRTLARTELRNVSLRPALADFSEMDVSFSDALRCIAAEIVLVDKNRTPDAAIAGFRLLRHCSSPNLFDISVTDVNAIESAEASRCKASPESASKAISGLSYLNRHLILLEQRRVIPKLGYSLRRSTRSEFAQLTRAHQGVAHRQRGHLLDCKIEALCEAMKASLSDDPRLTKKDRVTLALMGLQMCAPSRVNEVLCLATDDFVSLDDYVTRPSGQEQHYLHSVHQMLIVTMKGSKGAQWGAKPILNFMIDLFNHCLQFIIRHGVRSRTLAAWYEQNPNKLYLTTELEHFRGKDITTRDLWQIMNLRHDVDRVREEGTGSPEVAFRSLACDVRFKELPPRAGAGTRYRRTRMLPWASIEPYLLRRVHEGLARCRRVTTQNPYEGRLSKMLFLIDSDETPYIPSSLKYSSLISRLCQSDVAKAYYKKTKNISPEPTVFEKLGITMPVEGRVKFAEIGAHDPRRWLTTQALLSREKLPDVLINKWARRLNLEQLEHYDYRTPEQKADQSANIMPLELRDLSNGMTSMMHSQAAYGLNSEIVTVHDAGVSVTSMDAISAAVESRPIARASDQVLIIYPSWYGACIHQQHETPCRAYSSCLPCDNNLVVKGHLPTNDAVRKRHRQLHESIVRQLESHGAAHNRGIADDPQALAAHLLLTVERGLDPESLAEDLIDRFHEIKDLIKDASLRIKLEEAFVARGFVLRLNDSYVPAGALMKYHNPSRNASPGVERAFNSHGGRAKLARDRDRILKTHPQFTATSMGLTDQRSLSSVDESDEDDV